MCKVDYVHLGGRKRNKETTVVLESLLCLKTDLSSLQHASSVVDVLCYNCVNCAKTDTEQWPMDWCAVLVVGGSAVEVQPQVCILSQST